MQALAAVAAGVGLAYDCMDMDSAGYGSAIFHTRAPSFALV